MKKILIIVLSLFTIIGIGATWSSAYPSGTWRYEITVFVQTPEGLKSGSAVREATITRGPKGLSNTGFNAGTKGEAVVVDLGKRGKLFSVLGTDDYGIVFAAFPYIDGGATPEGIKYYKELEAETNLPQKLYPQLVKFSDISRPETIKQVDPNNLNISFGENVFLQGIKIKMTDEPVTSEIEKHLPWLPEYRDKRIRLNGKSGPIFTSDIADNLGPGSFRAGFPF